MFHQKIILALSLTAFVLWLPVTLPAEEGQQAAGMVLPKPEVEYSANISLTLGSGSFRQKTYYTPTRERRETATDKGNEIIIARDDRRVSWLLIPDQKMYMEFNVMKGRIKMHDILSYYRVAQTPDGEEVINSIPTRRSRVTITDARGKTYEGLMWVSMENIPLRIDAENRDGTERAALRMELTDLHIGKQDPDLFEIPDGFSRTVIYPGSIINIPVK